MEPPIPPSISLSEEELHALEGQIRESYGRVTYSHKTHEKCADIYHNRLNTLKISQIILSAITTAGLFFALFGESHFAIVLSTIASTVLLALNTYTKDFDFGELAQKHANTAGDLWYVRELYLSLLTDISGRAAPSQDIRETRDKLQEALKNIYQSAPRTFPKAYAEAQSALKLNEEMTFSDHEIDVMLPPFLRKTTSQSDR